MRTDLSLRQTVNQWLSIALISLMCFWVVLFYLVNKTKDIGSALTFDVTEVVNN